MLLRFFVFILVFSAAGLSASSLLAADLDEAAFQKLHAELQFSRDEPWQTIPWKTSLLDAQRTAAQEQKPIFLWAMDGHPLGCT